MAVDVFDTCIGTGDNPNYASQLQTVVVDKDGVEITGFIHADNYFELLDVAQVRRFAAADSGALAGQRCQRSAGVRQVHTPVREC